MTEGNPRWLVASSLMIAGCVLGGLVTWWIAAPTGSLPGDPTVPTTVSPSPPQVVSTPGSQPSSTPTGQHCSRSVPVLVMTFNIHHAARHGVLGLEQVAREIEAVDPDVVALQEVDRNAARSSYVDEAAWLGQRLDLTPLLGANRVRPGTPGHGPSEYGNALLTRLPVLNHQNLRMPNLAHLEPRGLLLATLDLDGIRLTVAATHFQHRPLPPRVLQSRYAVRALATQPGPRLLMGDLNDEPGTLPLRILNAPLHDLWPGVGTGSGLTHPVHHPDRRIDFVLGDDGIRAREAGVLVSRVSDHRAVWTRVDVTGSVPCTG